MFNAKVIVPFYDLQEKVGREPSDTFSCSDDRAKELSGLNLITAEKVKAEKKKK